MSKGSKNLSKNNRKLAMQNETSSLHYRMYKAGKLWLFAGIATFSLAAGVTFTQTAHADTTNAAAQTTEVVAASSAATTPAASDAASSAPASTSSTSAANKSLVKPASSDAQYSTSSSAAVAGQSGDVLKTTTTSTTTGTALDTSTEDFNGQVTAPTSATDTTTNGAAIKTGLFGSGLSAGANNSGTTGAQSNGYTSSTMGVDSNGVPANTTAADAQVSAANEKQDRAAGDYAEISNGNNQPTLDPLGQDQSDASSARNTTRGNQGDSVTDPQNDGLDESVVSEYVPDDTTTLDDVSDQGTFSSDSGKTNSGKDASVTRDATLYSQGSTDNFGDVSLIGSNQAGASFGIPGNLKDTLSVTQFKVVGQSYVGVILENTATDELFQIVDGDLGKDSTTTAGSKWDGDLIPSSDNQLQYYTLSAPTDGSTAATKNVINVNSSTNLGTLFAVGTYIDGAAVYKAVMNGGVVQQITNTVTSTVNDLSTLGGNIGKLLIGNGQSVTSVDNLAKSVGGLVSDFTGSIPNVIQGGLDGASALAAAPAAVSDITSAIGNILSSIAGTVTSDPSSTDAVPTVTAEDSPNEVGFSGLISSLVGLLGALGIDTSDFQAVYQYDIQQINKDIDDMNDYGKSLMDGDGVAQSAVLPAVENADKTQIDVKTPSGVGTADAILDDVRSYIDGWTSGIGNALSEVFTGNRVTDAPDANTFLTNTDGSQVVDSKTGQPIDIHAYNGMTALDVLDQDFANATDQSNSTLQGFIDQIATMVKDGITTALKAADTVNTNGSDISVQGVIKSVTSVLTNQIGSAISDGISGDLGGMVQDVAVPVQWTDPDYVNYNSDGTVDTTKANAYPGEMVPETFNTSANLYNQKQASSTTIVYQNVDKTQLRQLLSKASTTTPGYQQATTVEQNVNASQYDVDAAIKALGGNITDTTTTSTTTKVGDLKLTHLAGTTSATTADGGLSDATNLVKSAAVTSQIGTDASTNADPASATGTTSPISGLDLSNITTPTDLTVTADTDQPSDGKSFTYTYSYTPAGAAAAAADVDALDDATTDYSLVDPSVAPVSGTITLTVGDIAYTVTPVDTNGKKLATAVDGAGTAGDSITAANSGLAATYDDGTNTWSDPDYTGAVVPSTANGNVNITYKTSTPDTPTDGDVSYEVQPVDEDGNALADPSAALSGLPGDAADISGLAETYTDDNGKTWFKPAYADESFNIPADGGIVKVQYTDTDPTTTDNNNPGGGTTTNVTITKTPQGILLTWPDGSTYLIPEGTQGGASDTGTFTVNPDGTITFTDSKGNSATIDPSKLGGQPINITITNTNTATNPSDGSGSGTGTTTTTTTTTPSDPGKTTVVVLPGSDGQDGEAKVTQNPDGSYTITYPDGSTFNIPAGSTGTTDIPDGGSFAINPDGTITITDGKGNSYTFDPNKGAGGDDNTPTGTQAGSDVVTFIIPGNGSTTQPESVIVEKDTDGTEVIHFADGSSKTVKPGDTGTTPGGNTYVVNPDGSITFTSPDGTTSWTIDPADGETTGAVTKTTTTTTNNGGNTTNNTYNYYGSGADGSKYTTVFVPGKDGQNGETIEVEKTPAGEIILHLPDGTTKTVAPGDTGTLPNGTTYVVNPDGTITFTLPDGSTYDIDPNNGTPAAATDGNGSTTDSNNTTTNNITNNYYGTGTDGTGTTTTTDNSKTTTVVLPGSDGTEGTATVTKNADGSYTVTYPDGTSFTIPAGKDGSTDLPYGGTFTVNPDGTITITDGKGNSYSFDPSQGAGGEDQPSGIDPQSKVTVVVIPGQDGAQPETVTVEETPAGQIVLHFPDGTTKDVQPGDTGTTPAGNTYVVNPDGSVTFTTPDGKNSYTIYPNQGKTAGTTTSTTGSNNGGNTYNITNNYYGNGTDGTDGSKYTTIFVPGKDGSDGETITVEKTPEGTIILHMPDGTTKTVAPGDTGSLPNGTTYVVNPDGTLTFTLPDGSTYNVDPSNGKPAASTTSTTGSTNSNNTNSGNTTINNYYGDGTDGTGTPVDNSKTTTVILPGSDGEDGEATVTKNADGSYTVTYPNGSSFTIPAGTTGATNLPNGGTFTINPDGTITITDGKGNSYSFDPSKGAGGQDQPTGTQPGSLVTVIEVPGKDGADTIPVTIEKTPAGDIILHFPDGTTKTVEPGDTGTLSNGTTYVVNPDGTITFTTPDGATYKVDPSAGKASNTSTSTSSNGSGNVTDSYNTTNNYYYGDGSDASTGTSTTTTPGNTTTVVVTGKDGNPETVTVTKNPDGSYTVTYPDGTSFDIPAGKDTPTILPDGSTFTVNPDGTITITDSKGNSYTFDPSKGAGGATTPVGTQDGSKVSVVIVPGQNGQNPETITVEKTPAGDTIIHFPDGTSETVKHGDTGTLANGTKWTVNPDGTITFTLPDGSTFNVDPAAGQTSGTTTTTNNGGNTTIINNYYGNGSDGSTTGKTTVVVVPGKDGQNSTLTITKQPDGTITITDGEGNTTTTKPGESGTLPDGTKYSVDKDGNITFTTPDGGTFTINPDDGAEGNGVNVTINNQIGGDGSTASSTKGGQYKVTKNSDGSYNITFPDGSTVTAKPGENGTTADGDTYSVSDNGQVIITTPAGDIFVLAGSDSTTKSSTGTPTDTEGDSTTPSGNNGGSNTSTNGNDNGGDNGNSNVTTGTGSNTNSNTNNGNGNGGNGNTTANSGNGGNTTTTAANTSANGNNGAVTAKSSTSSASANNANKDGKLPQTSDAKDGAAAVGLLGLALGLFGLAGTRKRRRD